MRFHAQFGDDREFKLQSAILVYGDEGGAFATLHRVQPSPDGGLPYLNVAQPLTTAFLRALVEGLGASMKPEILPGSVLARTPEMIVWWTRARRRIMFFNPANEQVRQLNGRCCPHPPLVFKVCAGSLFVRAVASDQRPAADTPLRTAPYWNTRQDDGFVCPGSMRIPQMTSIESTIQWENSYFASEFTHPYGPARLTSFPGGFAALWADLTDSEARFPVQYLTDADQTLRSFVEQR
jgi:PRTRC genetic system protein B